MSFVPLQELITYETGRVEASGEKHKDRIQAYEQKQSRSPREESALNDKKTEAAKAVDAFKEKSAPKGFKQRVMLGGNDYMTATKEKFKRFLEGQRLNSRIELKGMGIEELAELVLARGDIESLLQHEKERKEIYEKKWSTIFTKKKIKKHEDRIAALEKAQPPRGRKRGS